MQFYKVRVRVRLGLGLCVTMFMSCNVDVLLKIHASAWVINQREGSSVPVASRWL